VHLITDCRVPSHKPKERELELRHYLGHLKKDVSLCSRATDEILHCHAQFAYLTAQRIDDASKSCFKRLKYGPDTTKLASDIGRASHSLSQHVMQMQDNLRSFVSALEKMGVRKKRSTARRIWRWLKHLFNALANIFAFVSVVSPFLVAVGPGAVPIASAASALSKATADFCSEESGAFLGINIPRRTE
jgi:hypothetical protein